MTDQIKYTDCRECFASKSRGTVIDVIHPDTGLTLIYGKSLADCRDEYPDAERTTLDAFCAWKAEAQRTPIEWSESSEDDYHDMMNVLPPALMVAGGFLVGEPWDHDALSGKPRYQAFRHRSGRYEVASRPMTRDEFREAI